VASAEVWVRPAQRARKNTTASCTVDIVDGCRAVEADMAFTSHGDIAPGPDPARRQRGQAPDRNETRRD